MKRGVLIVTTPRLVLASVHLRSPAAGLSMLRVSTPRRLKPLELLSQGASNLQANLSHFQFGTSPTKGCASHVNTPASAPHMKLIRFLLLALALSGGSFGIRSNAAIPSSPETQNIILITTDGLRW